MKMLFLEDVSGVALGGEVKDVKNGFARNYLIPKKLAVPATRDALQRVGRLKTQAEDQRLKTLADMKSLGEELDGTQVNIEMRSGTSGRLYGSVTNAVVAAELSKLTGREIDRRTIQIPESIREIGSHQASVRLHHEVTATISLLVYPAGTDPEEMALRGEEEGEEEAQDDQAAAETPGAEDSVSPEFDASPESSESPESPESESQPETGESPTTEDE